MRTTHNAALSDFLRSHKPVSAGGSWPAGTQIGPWQLIAFLGRGGSGEVYRAQDAAGTVAAVKLCKPRGEGEAAALARERFEREVQFLAQNRLPGFPHYLGHGSAAGVDYLAMELLQPLPLPKRDRAVAALLLQLCQLVGALHRRGWLHRDIKPQNVLCRADGTPVLADFGLVKAIAPDGARSVLAMTQVAGRGVGSGTPYFGAPEQFRGEALSPAVDIHALGVFIDTCFEGRPPHAWERIVSRATSSLPERRYTEVFDLAQAIRRRHWPKIGLAVAVALVSLLPVAFFWPTRIAKRAEALAAIPPVQRTQMDEATRWQQMGHLAKRTEEEEVTVREVWKDVPSKYPEFGETVKILAQREYRIETREIEVWEVPLQGEIVRFEQPLMVSAEREVRLVGPGTLDAQLEGEPEAKIVLEAGTVLLNRSARLLKQAKIYYRVGDGCYLNFTSLDEDNTARDFIEGGFWCFRGPNTREEFKARCQHQWYEEINREYGRQ